MSGIVPILKTWAPAAFVSVLILLQLRGRLSAEALAQKFEASSRTIYRHVDQRNS